MDNFGMPDPILLSKQVEVALPEPKSQFFQKLLEMSWKLVRPIQKNTESSNPSSVLQKTQVFD